MPMLTNIVITVPSIIQGDGVQLQPVALHALRISDIYQRHSNTASGRPG